MSLTDVFEQVDETKLILDRVRVAVGEFFNYPPHKEKYVYDNVVKQRDSKDGTLSDSFSFSYANKNELSTVAERKRFVIIDLGSSGDCEMYLQSDKLPQNQLPTFNVYALPIKKASAMIFLKVMEIDPEVFGPMLEEMQKAIKAAAAQPSGFSGDPRLDF